MPQRNFPRASSRRIFPRAPSGRIFPLPSVESYFVIAGASKFVPLGERVYPYAELEVRAPAGVTISTLERQYTGEGSWTTVTLGTDPDLVTALKFYSLVVGAYWTRTYRVRATYSDAAVRISEATITSNIRGLTNKLSKTDATLRVFSDAAFAIDATLIDTIKYEVAGATTVAKTAIPRETIITGAHDGLANAAALTDTSSDFILLGVNVGDLIANSTDGSATTITAITTTTNANDTLVGTLAGGAEDDWDVSDAYTITDGSNKILTAKNFQLGSLSAGVNRVTLYVKDTAATEVLQSCIVRVS